MQLTYPDVNYEEFLFSKDMHACILTMSKSLQTRIDCGPPGSSGHVIF